MSTITRSAHPSALWPGVKAWFGKSYDELPAEWSQVFEQDTSDKAYEELVETTGFGLAPQKSEGGSISYDTDGEGYKSRLTHVVYGLGYIVTEEELEDNLYKEVSERRARGLAFSMRSTAEVVHANYLNTGFAANGGDGVPLFSASHPTRSGTQSNLLSAADVSETALEDGLKTVRRAKNSRGLAISLQVKRLVVHPDEIYNVTRILESQLRVGTNNNDINAIKALGKIPEVVEMTRLTDTDAWFLQTNAPEGLKSMWRRKVTLEKDKDFDTSNAKAKATMRFAVGSGDWRAIFGNAGA
ncbi:hypothetical protein [Phenylobacterium deserti]|uniref:Bacteriophage Mu GpT domain-containing protein n=1 Tax=Phenylobacterium deserti TaxID=1914756 RepID=A0A328AGZ8_9CAUL|nr:hypothetical protein [Phenylobacterium deserti]RAK52128.1 hypothetical protein DJ018_13310 [Phenylobacterium deserti]